MRPALLLTLLFSTLVFSATAFGKTLLVLGDSISAGYGVELEDGWVNLLRERLEERGDYQVINASISGNTTTMGAGRLAPLLKKHSPDIVIIELGGNDGLQGHPVKVMERNLSEMVRRSQEAGAKVLLVGIQIPPNYGSRYAREDFHNIHQVQDKFDVPRRPST